MNKKRIFSLQLLLCAALSVQQIRTAAEITLDGDATAMAIHPKSGIVVIGTTSAGADGDVLVYAGPANGTDTEETTTIVTGAATVKVVANCLALSEKPAYNATVLADPNTDVTALVRAVYVTDAAPTVINAITLDGDTDTDTTYTPNDGDGLTNAGIVALDASSTHVFAAIKVNGGNFFAANSGVHIASINATTNAFTAGNLVAITVGADHIVSAQANAGNITPVTNTAALHWCPDLERLYVGLQGTTRGAAGDADDSFFAVVIAKSDGTIIPLMNNSHNVAFDTGANAGASNIVAMNTGAVEVDMAIRHLKTMKTSTGHYYLIVNGGIGDADGVANKMFAIPLVDSDGNVPGALAQVNDTAVGTTNFKKTATANTELFVESDTPAIIGGTTLPIQAAANKSVKQVVVVGDAVYCALTSNAINGNNEAGIYYSQALFNVDGSIASWTGWAKAVSNEVSGTSATDGSCALFALDAITGKIWTVEDDANTKVKVTQWVRDTDTTTFGGSVNALLNGPCYSSLNLHQHTANYAATARRRFAFFGGDSKVIVVKTGLAQADASTAVETPTNDWDAPTEVATDISTGLEGVGPINCLAWTNRDNDGADNYLLAGTNKGLYAYVSTAGDAGITIATAVPGAVNAAPFTTYEWKAVEAITDPVVKVVVTTANQDPHYFILTQGAQHKLWRINGDGKLTLDDLNGDVELVWTADGKDGNPSFLYDLAVVGTDGNNNLLLIATDKGIYQATDIAEAAATFAAAANLERLDLDAETNEVRSFACPLRTTLNQNVDYVRSMIRLNSNGKWATVKSALGSMVFTQDGSDYAQTLTGDTLAEDNNLLAIGSTIKSFYSDGARRFYIEAKAGNANGNHTLHIVPFYNGEDDYNVSEVADLADKAITDSKTFYWVNEMGAGYLMAGTNDGVVTLR